MRCGLIVLVFALVLWAGEGAASAAPWARTAPLAPLQSLAEAGSGIAALGLGGDRVAWLEWHGPRLEAYAAGPAGPVADVGGVTVPKDAGAGGQLYQAVLATPSLVAIQVAYTNCGGHPVVCTHFRRLGAVRPVQGQLHVAPGCDLSKPLAVSGAVVATSSRVCDLDTGASWPLPTGTFAARLAGDVAAIVLSDGSLRVENWRSGAVLYREPAGAAFSYYPPPPDGPGPVDTRQFDVQADGTAVFNDSHGNLDWASVAHPRPHPFFSTGEGSSGASAAVRLAGGLVATGVTIDERPGVEVVDLAGHERALLPLLGGYSISKDDLWDLGASGLAWFTRPCQEGVFAVAGVEQATAFQPAPSGPCAAPVLSADGSRLLGGGRVRIDYTCPAAAVLGCLATTSVTLRARVGRGVPVRDGYLVIEGPLLGVDPGVSGHLDVPLPRGARRLLACQPSVAVSVTARGAENVLQPPVASTPAARLSFRLKGGGRRCR